MHGHSFARICTKFGTTGHPYRVGQKSDTARTYITLYERYHFLAHPVYPTDGRKVGSTGERRSSPRARAPRAVRMPLEIKSLPIVDVHKEQNKHTHTDLIL